MEDDILSWFINAVGLYVAVCACVDVANGS